MHKQFHLDSFTTTVCKDLSAAIKRLFQKDTALAELAGRLTPPPRGREGHWALPCFFLQADLKKPPFEIAQTMAQAYSQNPSKIFKEVRGEGGYVNFFFHPGFLIQNLLKPLKGGGMFHIPKKNFRCWLVEYSQPNTHKDLHVGHLRNLCFGLSLVSLLKKRGFPVKTCTFPGDVGAHVGKCLWYLKQYNKEPVPGEKPAGLRGRFLGRVYARACSRFDQDLKNPALKDQTKKQARDILHHIQNKEGEFYRLWQETRLWSCNLMKEIYQSMGAQFDKWYWESEVDAPSVQWIKELYKTGRLEKSDGAVGLNLGENLGFCLLLKSDGGGLYAAKDLYLARQKVKDYNPEKSIYIVDQRQEKHFKQIKAVLERVGLAEEAGRMFHLKYNFVELKTGPISSREGGGVSAGDLINNMSLYVKNNFLNKYKAQWSEDQIQNTAGAVAEGALKYGMNDQDLNKKIVFDMKEWLKWDGCSGPYLQYAYARASTLLSKFDALKDDFSCLDRWDVFSPEEEDLIVHLSWFSLVMEKSAWQMKTALVCRYLFDLAKLFSRFYQNCPVGGAKDEAAKSRRLFLVQTVRAVLKEGLSYLAIPCLEKM